MVIQKSCSHLRGAETPSPPVLEMTGVSLMVRELNDANPKPSFGSSKDQGYVSVFSSRHMCMITDLNSLV